MPTLALFAACEKVIIDQSTNVVSLIALLQNVNVQTPPGTVVPANLMLPMQWAALSIWQRLPEDQDKVFEQRSQLVDASGEVKLETPIAVFELKADFHRLVNQIAGMPVGTSGPHRVRCMLREQRSEWKEAAAYPIHIVWATVNAPTFH